MKKQLESKMKNPTNALRNTELVLQLMEAVVRRRSVKKVFLEISQNSQENTCARVFCSRPCFTQATSTKYSQSKSEKLPSISLF